MKIKIIGTEDQTKGRFYKIEVAVKEVDLLLYYPTAKRYFNGGRNFADKILP